MAGQTRGEQALTLYHYEAYEPKQGRTVKGVWWAPSQEKAEFWLAGQGLQELRLQPSPLSTGQVRVSQDQLALFFRQMAVMFGAGVLITDSLRIAGETTDTHLAGICRLLNERLQSGYALSRAMALFPRVFSPVVRALVKAAESSGRLHKALESLAQSAEKFTTLRKTVISAATYPAIVIFSTFLLTALFVFYVFPLNHNLFSSSSRPLSVFGRIISTLGAFLGSPWAPALMLLALGAIFLGLRELWQQPRFKERVYLVMLGIPPVRSFLDKVAALETLEVLSLVISGGGTIDAALKLLSQSSAYQIRTEAFEGVRQEIMRGSDFSQALQTHRIVPAVYSSLLQVGHESGRLETMTAHASRLCEEDVERSLETMAALVEPVLLAFAGVLAGGAILLSALPLLDLISSL